VALRQPCPQFSSFAQLANLIASAAADRFLVQVVDFGTHGGLLYKTRVTRRVGKTT